ncbi:MAG: glycosyltransferase family 87 protein, partial [Anaerolineales bacterium]
MPISRQFLPFSYLLGIAFLVIVILRIVDLTLQNEFPLGYDARSYVVAARAIREGFSPYDEVHRVEFAPDVVFSKYLYPPVLAVLLVPLSAYPILSVTYGLVFLAFLSAVVFAVLLSRSTGWKLALLAVFLFPPTWHTIYLGQVNLAVAALMLLALYDVDSDRRY